MSLLSSRLTAYLDEHGAQYYPVHHRRDFTAQAAAAHTHTSGWSFAKTVVLNVDDHHVMAIVPAPQRVDLDKVRRKLHANEVRMTDESEFTRLFPDSEVGAEPPFGDLYDMEVIMDPVVADSNFVTFNGGSHEDVIRMPAKQFVNLLKPRIMEIAA
ncbi:MAG: aminoacyl-tRNA deacylase [Planctomycetota bacterium]|jgi:Ala-tRNA(Pro) deacylase